MACEPSNVLGTTRSGWFGRGRYLLEDGWQGDAEGETDPKDLARLQEIIKTWLKNKVIETEERKDDKGKDRKFIVAGSFRADPPNPALDDEIIE